MLSLKPIGVANPSFIIECQELSNRALILDMVRILPTAGSKEERCFSFETNY